MVDADVPGFEVQGFEVQALLGFGAGGEVWRGRQQPSGDLVVLRRLAGPDKALLARIRADATVVRSLPSAHLVRLRTLTRAADEDVLVLDHAAAGSLEALLARRRRVEPGEVVTAVAPLAEALGQAHRHGLVHGRVSASSVLLTAEGKPLLEGLGLTCLYDVAGAPGAASDVWDLGALAYLMLTGEAPGTAPLAGTSEQADIAPLAGMAPTAPLRLVHAVESALAADPASRPSAADFAAALLAACPALPLQGLPEVTPDPTLPVAPSGQSRRLLVGAVAVLALLMVVAGGRAWGRHSAAQPLQVAAAIAPAAAATNQAPASTRPAAAGTNQAGASTRPATGWPQVLRQLDLLRAQAFARADPAGLARVYTEGSALLVADRQSVAGLARQRRTAVGVMHVVRSVVPIAVGPDRVELRVTESLAAYELRGSSTSRQPAGPVVEHVVVLVHTAAGWRVGEVRVGGSALVEAGQER